MDVDGSAERRGPACGCGCCLARRARGDGDGRIRRRRSEVDKERVTGRQIYGPGMEEGQTCPGCRPGENGERRDDVEEPELRRNGRDTQRELVML